MEKELKSVTVYDKLNRKHVVKPGEKWMHGDFGVVTIEKATRKDNKAWSTVLYYTLKNGERRAAGADYRITSYVVKCNLLFKI